MPQEQLNVRQEIIDKLTAYAKNKLGKEKSKPLADFIPFYFKNVPLHDLAERSIADLYGTVLSHWELMEIRKPKECKVRVYNPNFEEHGWQSTHTIVELSYDDMPFLVDSMRMEINRLGFTSHLYINLGGIKLKRNSQGRIIELFPADEKDIIPEAAIHMEIDKETDTKALENIRINLLRVLKDVTNAVEDWEKIRDQVFKALDELDKLKAPNISREDIEESKAFLRWLVNDHFTFLGYREYRVIGEGDKKALELVKNTGIGVLCDESKSKVIRYYTEFPVQARNLILSNNILIISKTNTKSSVHRPTYTDYIGVKRFDEKGKVIGEHRFIGLYTSDAYNSNPKHIPFLRLKVETVLQKSGLPRGGHGAKALRNILETLPRDDLLQADTNELYDLAMDIFHMQERRRIRLFVRKDAYGRYFSCLVYVPRENFNTELLYQMQNILQQAFQGTEVSFTTHFSESILARIHFIVRIDPKKPIEYNTKEIENKLVEVARLWIDDLRDSLIEHFGEERGNELINRYTRAFPVGYRDEYSPNTAIYDIEHIEKLSSISDLEMSFYRPAATQDKFLKFKLFHAATTITLSDALPMLENMGIRVIDEQSYEITLPDNSTVWINDFTMTYSVHDLNIEETREIFQNAFDKIWRGEAENDGFNRLVLRAQLNWREVSLFRAYAKYLRQTGFTFSQQYIEESLINNPKLAILLIKIFKLRFDPLMQNDNKEKTFLTYEEEMKRELDAVSNLDQDRILRRYWEMIRATLRTNFFQLDDKSNPKPYIAFKFDPKLIPELPLPLPMYEIFIYSPRFEGVHLRAGKVARGGLRWSDRREDFRTEVLGLMKAQQVKNAIIVPAGAKGGFVIKTQTEGTREAWMAEGIACYKNFIRGLLDITDNIINDKVTHPKDTVYYDHRDPYLVVAADKGTATFSDIANSISKEYEFWLGDAFASGGSTGYDHKKMAITSRGVWESVKQHFQQLNIDIKTLPFTTVGIGDMAGDVFGNGMLLSENNKLIGAFNHIHIFLDPNPDTKISFQERKRLFQLPRSTWEDYNPELISKGGGVYKPSLKAISLSPEIKRVLDVKQDVMTPNELIRALLKAPVDLIWNGGIGTYVKASFESNNEVGDRANDAVRINGHELRCKVVGEGGNLGWTQLGRIEYELNGGKINTDFIDNSGGVDCSDHEVNIKILLNELIARGELTEKQRNHLLAEMTEEVAGLVLENNYRQVRAITIAHVQSPSYLNLYRRYIETQERNGKINRQLEFLPDDKILTERRLAGKGLTRPEIAVLLAYSKIILKNDVLHSDLTKDSGLSHYVEYAFPQRLKKQYAAEMLNHRLYPEIVATQLSNALVTDMGIAFVYQMEDETGASMPNIMRAYAATKQIFDMSTSQKDIYSLDYKVNPDLQLEMMLEIMRLVRRGVRWFLRNRHHPMDVKSTTEQFAPLVTDLYKRLPELLVGTEKADLEAKIQELTTAQVPLKVASRIAGSRYIYSALNIIQAATDYHFPINEVADIYFTLANRLELVWFREKINAYPVDDHWSVLARASFKDELDCQQRALTISVLKYKSKEKSVDSRITAWFEEHRMLIERWQAVVSALRASNVIESAMLSVAIRELMDLAQISEHDQETSVS